MYKVKSYLFYTFTILFLYGCKTSKNEYYSYKVNTYTIDTVKRLLTSTSLISYGSYLFEFRNFIKIKSEQYRDNDPIVTSFKFDTVSVYLWGNNKKIYYEFDSFALQNKIIQTGLLSKKPSGVKFIDVDKSTVPETFYAAPKDTVINTIKYFYSEVLPKKTSPNDTTKTTVLLIKNANLNSLLKMSGAEFTDKEYCIVGFSLYYPKANQALTEEIDDLKPLTTKEKEICQNIIAKSKTCVTDTIK